MGVIQRNPRVTLVECVLLDSPHDAHHGQPRRIGRSSKSLIFTLAMTTFVLAPLMFAFGALLTEAHALILEIAAADKKGIAAPQWLENAPLVGPWLAARWQNQLASPGAILTWTQRTDAAAVLVLAQSLGQFMARHAFIILFTILLLFFLYQDGESLVDGFRSGPSVPSSRATTSA